MSDQLSINVVIEQRILRGSDQDYLQRVATVYVDGDEYRVLAPPRATGDSLEWIGQFRVHRPDPEAFNSEIPVAGVYSVLAIKEVQEKLKDMKRDENRPVGLNPDGLHCDAQICLQGHVQSADGSVFDKSHHCTKCGSACIDDCQLCKTPIRGPMMYSPTSDFVLPNFCHGCGKPYPWMQIRLDTARELLNNDAKLSFADREELWGLLQYVMSDPKADLVPAKKKLIGIKLENAGALVREALLDLIAKTAAESLKQ